MGVEFRTHRSVDDLNTLPADRVVLAAGSWSGKLAPHVRVRPARGQMILVAAPPQTVRCILLWKDRYVIPRRDGRLLLGSTVEDVGFDSRVTEAGLAEILRSVGRIAPKVAALPVERTWAGLRPRTPDRLPVLGAEGKVVHATGHFRNGILLAPITARLVREVVEERTPSVKLEPFAASRFRS